MMAQNAERAKRPLEMPVLAIGGEKNHSDEVGQAFESLATTCRPRSSPRRSLVRRGGSRGDARALTPFLAPYRDAWAAVPAAVG